jgi:hypothetical protein
MGVLSTRRRRIRRDCCSESFGFLPHNPVVLFKNAHVAVSLHIMIERSYPPILHTVAAVLLHGTLALSVWGFVPTSPIYLPSRAITAASPLFTTSLQAAPIPNPFRKLPWNVEREERRQAQRLRLERSALHRELGIAEDATYEEIVAATDALIARAEGNMKRKIQIEVAKDKILQIRLNERLAGLTRITTEAKAQSSFETSG